eukprot:TRINITY_DN5662_c0_g3_i2.p1 TRINITY_DN5662_c0_g3~~TRINITY_DN5662_c0_g3_i2.p1  ORF type:complete len:645 (-),score=278.64 TRINITY_DN5662_c0_g3_i2:40-1974(-)
MKAVVVDVVKDVLKDLVRNDNIVEDYFKEIMNDVMTDIVGRKEEERVREREKEREEKEKIEEKEEDCEVTTMTMTDQGGRGINKEVVNRRECGLTFPGLGCDGDGGGGVGVGGGEMGKVIPCDSTLITKNSKTSSSSWGGYKRKKSHRHTNSNPEFPLLNPEMEVVSNEQYLKDHVGYFTGTKSISQIQEKFSTKPSDKYKHTYSDKLARREDSKGFNLYSPEITLTNPEERTQMNNPFSPRRGLETGYEQNELQEGDDNHLKVGKKTGKKKKKIKETTECGKGNGGERCCERRGTGGSAGDDITGDGSTGAGSARGSAGDDISGDGGGSGGGGGGGGGSSGGGGGVSSGTTTAAAATDDDIGGAGGGDSEDMSEEKNVKLEDDVKENVEKFEEKGGEKDEVDTFHRDNCDDNEDEEDENDEDDATHEDEDEDENEDTDDDDDGHDTAYDDTDDEQKFAENFKNAKEKKIKEKVEVQLRERVKTKEKHRKKIKKMGQDENNDKSSKDGREDHEKAKPLMEREEGKKEESRDGKLDTASHGMGNEKTFISREKKMYLPKTIVCDEKERPFEEKDKKQLRDKQKHIVLKRFEAPAKSFKDSSYEDKSKKLTKPEFKKEPNSPKHAQNFTEQVSEKNRSYKNKIDKR